jgi:hypothetical protein
LKTDDEFTSDGLGIDIDSLRVHIDNRGDPIYCWQMAEFPSLQQLREMDAQSKKLAQYFHPGSIDSG